MDILNKDFIFYKDRRNEKLRNTYERNKFIMKNNFNEQTK